MDRDDEIKALVVEIHALSAETIAIQHILTNVLAQIGKVNPALGEAIEIGLNDAANEAENFAIRTGKAAPPEHTVKAIQVVEELRAATLGNKKKPRSGI